MKRLTVSICLVAGILIAPAQSVAADPITSDQNAFAAACPMYKEMLPYRGANGWVLIETVRRTALAPCAAITSMISQMNQAQGKSTP